MVRGTCYICGRNIHINEKTGELVTVHKGQNRGCWYKAPIHTEVYWSADTCHFERRMLCWRCAKNSIELLKEVTT